MKNCPQKKLVYDLFFNNLSEENIEKLENHLKHCTACHHEVSGLKEIANQLNTLKDDEEEIMDSIDWQNVSRRIMHRFESRYCSKREKEKFILRIPTWKMLLPVLALFFGIGVMLGYIIFQTQYSKQVSLTKPVAEKISLELMESVVARREILNHIKQAQFILTDLMNQCQESEVSFWQERINIDRIRKLLVKSKYFHKDMNDPNFLYTKGIIQRIEWLLYELLTMDDFGSCKNINRLQLFINQEKLLFKIRLIEKELLKKNREV